MPETYILVRNGDLIYLLITSHIFMKRRISAILLHIFFYKFV